MAWLTGRRRAQLERQAAVLADALEVRLAEVIEGRVNSTATVARLPTTIASRALIADTGAMPPLVAVRDGAPVTPTPSVLVRPDPDPSMSRRRWVHRALMSLTGDGNLYLLATRLGTDGWPLAAEVVPPGLVAASPDPYRPWRAAGWSISGQAYGLADVVHVPLWELTLDQLSARSPLAEAQAALDDLAVMWAFAAGYWREGGKPPYALKYPSRLSPAQAATALDQWVAARMAHRPGLVTGGWEIQDLAMPTAQDSLLLDGLAYIDQVIVRLYGVPPTLLNTRAETGSLTYSNARDEVVRWLSLSLGPTWLARVEDAATQLLPRGQQAVFDTAGLTGLGMARPGLDEGRPEPVAAPPAPDRIPDPPVLTDA
jgi:phage portal protein BeeE